MAEIRVKETGTIKLFESDNTSSVTIASPASLGADRTVTLPDANVTLASGTMLATDGSGASLTALNASELGSGTVPTARLGSGTASSTTVLYGDQTYKAEPGLTGWTTGGTSNSLIPSATDQGIYLGVATSTAANLLDDYEEGTFTPVVSGGTIGIDTIYVASYTKIGRMVYISFYCDMNTGGDGTQMIFTGLPFTVSGDASGWGAVNYYGTGTAAHVGCMGGGTAIQFFKDEGAPLPQNEVGSAHLQMSAAYQS